MYTTFRATDKRLTRLLPQQLRQMEFGDSDVETNIGSNIDVNKPATRCVVLCGHCNTALLFSARPSQWLPRSMTNPDGL